MTIKKASLTVDRSFRIDTIDQRLFSAFLEPIGPTISGGYFRPGHPMSDEQGFRADVLKRIKELGIPAIRLPGGNFVSGYDWRDSIGPLDKRKAFLDLAWRQIDTNRFGLDEYMDWCRKAGSDPMYTLNLATLDLKASAACVEYCNHEKGTYWSDLRRTYGHESPYGIKTWYLGNEPDGPWEIGNMKSREYGKKAREMAKMIKWICPDAETVVCGSSSPLLRSYPMWDVEALDECYELVDYIGIHQYHLAPRGDVAQMMAGSELMESFIKTTIATCDLIQAKYRHPRKMKISFDEYGLGFSREQVFPHHGRGGQIPNEVFGEFMPSNYAHPFYEFDPEYDPEKPMKPRRDDDGFDPMIGAIGDASSLLLMLKYADRIKIAVMTGGLGCIGYDDEKTWLRPTYYILSDLINYARGTALIPALDTPTYSTEGFNINDFHQAPPYEKVPYIQAIAVDNEDGEHVTVFAINRAEKEDIPFEIDVRELEGYELVSHTVLETKDGKAVPRPSAVTKMSDGKIETVLNKLSWNVIRLRKG
ncbi:MAG: alpha-L-arabinofuranosidase [Christensenellaceae bacterium]|nr:alpha-L-arabinofuranosidase [Christensenellaceae bacterium]